MANRRSGMADKKEVKILILSAACCVPGMEALDREARKRIEKAISETKVAARVEVIPATKAYFSLGAVRGVLKKAMTEFNESGAVGLPAIMINGTAISYGVPKLEVLKSALKKAAKGDKF